MTFSVKYAYTFEYTLGATNRVLSEYVTGAVVSLDLDRVPYGTATVTLGGVPAATAAMFDPRRSTGRFKLYVHQLDATTPAGMGPVTVSRFYAGAMLLTDLEESELDDTLTLQLVTLERLFEDKKRVSGNVINTGATTLGGLITYSLGDVTGLTGYYDTAGIGSTALPAGDRRLMQPGESHWELLEAELNAVNARLLYDTNGEPHITARGAGTGTNDDATPTAFTTVTGSTLGDDEAFMVTDIRRTITRGEDYADGILARFSYTKSDGTSVVAYQASGAGANTRARVVDFDRSPPGNNLAQYIANRAVKRGTAYDVRARAWLYVRPGQTLRIKTATGTSSKGTIRAVWWDFGTGDMTIRSEIGAPT